MGKNRARNSLEDELAAIAVGVEREMEALRGDVKKGYPLTEMDKFKLYICYKLAELRADLTRKGENRL